MAITVSEAATLVSEQLNVPSGATPPTTQMLQDYIARAARRLFSAARPVFLTNVTLSTNLEVAVSNKARILHVEINNRPLVLSEWIETDDSLRVTSYNNATVGDEAYVWYIKSSAIADEATSIDLDCIHGADWGYEALVTYAEMLALERMAQTDPANANIHWSGYRVVERRYEQQMAELRQARSEDLQQLGQRVSHRISLGDGFFRESGLSGFLNESNLIDRTAGES